MLAWNGKANFLEAQRDREKAQIKLPSEDDFVEHSRVLPLAIPFLACLGEAFHP